MVFDYRLITDNPAEAKAAGEALWAATKEAGKKMMDEQEELEREKAEAKKDLEGVEPSGRDVQNAMKSTEKQHRVEVRSRANPPLLIRMALESACTLLSKSGPRD